ncbi:gamma-glutamyl hydrolase-like [Penaeus japonicus]|uniref:gamma-glutamyl hydrolase-like n=1 Tax=Penaeus japonicus TaxID=27405 RepID=UPI001C7143F9|nr:gamma-glutamyl hydrolase-like [Penaeus japonicus]
MAGQAVLTLGVLAGVLCSVHAQFDFNLRPIIGILSQAPSDSILEGLEDKNYTSYIAASYVKHFESAGARVVPILLNQDDVYYENLAKHLNGFVFPGGANSITNSSGYGAAGAKIYQHVLERNSKGVYLPLWGTCLGFEMITYLAAGEKNWLASCHASNKADPLTLAEGFMDSRIFTQMPDYVITYATYLNATVNFHKWCMTPENFTVSGLNDEFKLLATSFDFDGLEYVALMEHNALPIFGSQFHSEKVPFEWKNDDRHDAIPHSPQAIGVAHFFANFFATQARLNSQKFPTEKEETEALIYNYKPFFTLETSGFVQVYLFR